MHMTINVGTEGAPAGRLNMHFEFKMPTYTLKHTPKNIPTPTYIDIDFTLQQETSHM